MRQRRHSPCVSGPPQVGQVSVNAIDLFNSGRRSKSMPRLITPAPSPLRAGCVSRSTRVKLLRSKSCRLHAGHLFPRCTFVWLSAGEGAYRYASITLTIIVLIPRANPAWIVALHRFIEVSVGIIVALLVVAIWPERSPIAAKNEDQ